MHGYGPKGNVAGRKALQENAEAVVRALLAGETLITRVMTDYKLAYPTVKKVYWSRTTPKQRAAVRRRKLLRWGAKGRFRKGHATWNKGLKGIHLSLATEFKVGCLRGAAARKWRPVGSLTIRHDSASRRLRDRKRKGGGRFHGRRRRWIKVRDDGRIQDRWIPYARWLWMRANGTIPAGYNIVHLDGDTLGDRLDNLALMTDAERMAHQRRIDLEMDARRIRAVVQGVRHRRPRQQRLRVWDCPACGHLVAGPRRPNRCAKCGCYSLIQCVRRMAI